MVLIMSAPVLFCFFCCSGVKDFWFGGTFFSFETGFFQNLAFATNFRILRRVYNPESPGMYKTQGKQWDKLPTNWSARFLPSTVYLN